VCGETSGTASFQQMRAEEVLRRTFDNPVDSEIGVSIGFLEPFAISVNEFSDINLVVWLHIFGPNNQVGSVYLLEEIPKLLVF
jgi:hypothetical protein